MIIRLLILKLFSVLFHVFFTDTCSRVCVIGIAAGGGTNSCETAHLLAGPVGLSAAPGGLQGGQGRELRAVSPRTFPSLSAYARICFDLMVTRAGCHGNSGSSPDVGDDSAAIAGWRCADC